MTESSSFIFVRTAVNTKCNFIERGAKVHVSWSSIDRIAAQLTKQLTFPASIFDKFAQGIELMTGFA
jgi:hypothetical protein